MAHRSGITASIELQNFLNEHKNSDFRSFKIIIHDEQMELDGKDKIQCTFEEDFDQSVTPYIEDKSPCYVMVRFDTKNDRNDFYWLFIAYSPDESLVRDKMKYAATRNAFKRIFNTDLIIEEMFVNKKKDVCYKAYEDHIIMKNAPTPLTDAEVLFQEEIGKEQYHGVQTLVSNLPGVNVVVDDETEICFKEFADGKINYLQLAINPKTEKIVIMHKKKIPVTEIVMLTPDDEPRFHLINYPHNYEGSSTESKVFLYSVPGFKCPVKLRMIYSTYKSATTQIYEDKYGQFDKKIEVTDKNEITEDFLQYELHPLKEVPKQKFNKPQRPGRR